MEKRLLECRHCGWKGPDEKLEPLITSLTEKYQHGHYRCPSCGHSSFYRIFEKERGG